MISVSHNDTLFLSCYADCVPNSCLWWVCMWQSSCIQVQQHQLQTAFILACLSQGAHLWASSWHHCIHWLFFGDLQGSLWHCAFLQPPISDIIIVHRQVGISKTPHYLKVFEAYLSSLGRNPSSSKEVPSTVQVWWPSTWAILVQVKFSCSS